MTYTGRGAHARARKAIRVEAQLTPRFLYMGVTKSGKLGVSEVVFLNQAGFTHPTPKRDRSTEFAARTEAAYRRYESMR